MNNFPKLSRRDFFKALVSLGVVASFPIAKALPVTRKVFKDTRYMAIWQPPGQRAKLTMFAGDIPPGTEVFVAGGQRILRFTRYPEPVHPDIAAHEEGGKNFIEPTKLKDVL